MVPPVEGAAKLAGTVFGARPDLLSGTPSFTPLRLGDTGFRLRDTAVDKLSAATRTVLSERGVVLTAQPLDRIVNLLGDEQGAIGKELETLVGRPTRRSVKRIGDTLVTVSTPLPSPWTALVVGETLPPEAIPLEDTRVPRTRGTVAPSGVADLILVRQQLIGYAGADIAHIENVLRGESKQREHIRRQEHATDVAPPPEIYRTKPFDYQAGGGDSKTDYTHSGQITIDDGYMPVQATCGTVMNTWQQDCCVDVIVGSRPHRFSDDGNWMWTTPMAEERDSVPITVQTWRVSHVGVTVEVKCQRTDRAMAKWRLETHAKLTTACLARLSEYEAQIAALQLQAGVVIHGRNPEANQLLVADELRKNCVSILTDQHFDMFGAVDTVYGADGRAIPQVDIAEAAAEGAYVRFFEQAFEWEHLTWAAYPYVWGRKDKWDERLTYEDPDPQFNQFLKAGYCRVTVPVRPGFEDHGRGIDVGHMLIGLEVRSNRILRTRNFPGQGGTGLEIVTWLGDLGGGAANLAKRRILRPTGVEVIFHNRTSDYGVMDNLEGDIAGYPVGCGATPGGPPQYVPGKGIADALAGYLPLAGSTEWATRARRFAQALGATVSPTGITNKTDVIDRLADKLYEFAVWYAATRWVPSGELLGPAAEKACQHMKGAAHEVATVFVTTLASAIAHPPDPVDAAGPYPGQSATGPCASTLLKAASTNVGAVRRQLDEWAEEFGRLLE
ncbi:hypothetical protein ACTVZO_01160 [Streptomyces sp. IBSNAI002]|uniref:hypothetical protein n=1 Tax=Streptomyces sp. IBSNAI002 TaxID=3457500 RepID=UPI003FD0A7CE